MGAFPRESCRSGWGPLALAACGELEHSSGMPEESATVATGAPETSESEEMYLITVAMAEEDGNRGPLAMAALGSSLSVSPASVNEMVRKLDRRGLFDYQPYRGVELTEQGRGIARRVLRTRRLWSRFLADRLDLSPQRADALACQLEHVTPGDAADRLATYLGDPETGPLGRPIPAAAAAPLVASRQSLASVAAGVDVEVIAIVADDIVSGYLGQEGITPGVKVRVLATGTSGSLLDVQSRPLSLSAAVAAAVQVRPLGGDM